MNYQNMWMKPWIASLVFHAIVLLSIPLLPWPETPKFEELENHIEVDYIEIKRPVPKGLPDSGGDGGDGSGKFMANLPTIASMAALPEYSEPLTSNNEDSIITKHQDTKQNGYDRAGVESTLGGDAVDNGSGGSAGFESGNQPGIQGEENGEVVDTTFYRPVPTYTPKPRYPRAARNKGVRGSVGVGLTIGADGSVESAWVVDSSGSELLDQAAVDAVNSWRFEPARRGNEPVSTTTSVNVEFQLR
ncbi:energy transducer TonB [Veillonella intestinalis]|uniref:energy transducer TonB n=1 Tax=Veillonella intestinalis TaxID=2941341 RepID=UPI00203EA6FA|nr:energy transducer TonB [Veillonella intestinalis]